MAYVTGGRPVRLHRVANVVQSPACTCSACRTRDPLGQWYEPESTGDGVAGWYGQPSPAPAATACPVGPRVATDRCGVPQPCPAVPTLLCMRGVGGVPFEYVDQVATDPATGLNIPARRIANHQQRFIPAVEQALVQFLTEMRGVGLPVEAILTAGSLYCRCISGTSRLSNHSFGDAIDVVGVRWAAGTLPGRLRETIVHNFRDPAERAVLRRINALLRLAFATVLDYHRHDHRDHFHCDTNRGRGRSTLGRSTIAFVQESLNVVAGRRLTEHGRFDGPTRQALVDSSGGHSVILSDPAALNRAIDTLFRRIAVGPAASAGMSAGAGAATGAAAGPTGAAVASGAAAGAAAAGARGQPPAPPSTGRSIDARKLLNDAIAGGVTNPIRLTDVLFHARHPERSGRPIGPDEVHAVQEWRAVRDLIVRPELARRAP